MRPQVSPEGTEGQKNLEIFLRTANVASVNKGGVGGRTGPWVVSLDDGKTRKRTIFKYVNAQRPASPPDSYKYDLAAYELTKLLGIEMIPPIVEREVEKTMGTLQIFLEDCIREKERRRKKIEPPDPKAFGDAMEDVKVLEILTLDECMDRDDTYIHREEWRVWRVDFSEAFFPSPELPEGCEITRCSKKFYQALLRLPDDVIVSTMKPYLNEEEIDALLKRKCLIIEKINKLIEDKGEAAVLF